MSRRIGVVLLLGFACSFSVSLEDESGPPLVAFEDSLSGADELAGTLMIPVILSRAAETEVSVMYSLLNANTATPGVDFTITTGTLVFAPGEVRKQIPVTINDDNDESEDVETFDIALSSPVGAQLDQARAIHSIRIADHILPRITIGPTTSMASEDAPSSLVIRLDRPAEPDSSIVIGVAGGNPAPADGNDLTIVDGTQVAIPEGAMMVSVPIGEKDDALDEEDPELVVFTLRSPSPNLVIGATSAQTHAIADNDLAPIVRFTNPTTAVTEGGTTVTPIVSLSAPSGRIVRVSFARDGSDSASGSDAIVIPGTISFDPGETSDDIAVVILGDDVDEDAEEVILELSNPVNATLGTTASHTITINDNDTASVSFALSSSIVDEEATGGTSVRVRLSTPSSKTVSVPFSVNLGSSATAGVDYSITTSSPLVFSPGTTQRDINMDVPDTAPGNEGNETVILDLGPPTNAPLGGTTRHTVVIQE